MEEIKSKAESVALVAEGRDVVRGIERKQAKALLLTLVSEIMPVLPELTSRIVTGSQGMAVDFGSHPNATYHDLDGLRVQGSLPRLPREAGPFNSEALYLLSDGSFARIEVDGSVVVERNAHAIVGAKYAWIGEVIPMQLAEVIADGWRVEDIVSEVSKALSAQLKGLTRDGSRSAAIAHRFEQATIVLAASEGKK